MADDARCFVTDTKWILEIMKILDTFKTYPGLNVHVNKIKAKFIELYEDRVDPPPWV